MLEVIMSTSVNTNSVIILPNKWICKNYFPHEHYIPKVQFQFSLFYFPIKQHKHTESQDKWRVDQKRAKLVHVMATRKKGKNIFHMNIIYLKASTGVKSQLFWRKMEGWGCGAQKGALKVSRIKSMQTLSILIDVQGLCINAVHVKFKKYMI